MHGIEAASPMSLSSENVQKLHIWLEILSAEVSKDLRIQA